VSGELGKDELNGVKVFEQGEEGVGDRVTQAFGI